MKQIAKNIKEHKNLWIFLTIILIFGIGIGIYFGITYGKALENTLTNYALTDQATHFSLTHFVTLSLLLITSFLFIGIPLAISYLFYEGMSIGFCITLFTTTFHWKGFIYIFLFIVLTKLIYFLIYYFFFSKLINIGKSLISWLIYKKNKKDYIIHLAIGCFILILILFCYDLFLDFIGIKAIHALRFLLT